MASYLLRVEAELSLKSWSPLRGADQVEDSEGSRLSERALIAEFQKLGGKIVAQETFKNTDDVVRGQLAKIKASNPEALYVLTTSGRPMAVAFRQISETGLKPKHIFANHLIEDPEVKALGSVTDGVIYTTTEISEEFAGRFAKKFGYDANANAGKHYDATRILIEGLKRAGTTDAKKLRDAIYNLGEYNGAIGRFTFNGSGEPEVFPIVKIIREGKYVRYDG